MSIFAKSSKSSFDHYDAYGSIKVEDDGLVLRATDGVHGTDGEGNATDTSSKKEKTDGQHGTDGEDFGVGESVKKDKKKRRTDLLNMAGKDGVAKWSQSESRNQDGSMRQDGAMDKENEFLMDSVPNDDEEYLSDAVQGVYGESEAGLFRRMIYKSKSDRNSSQGVAHTLRVFFARLSQKKLYNTDDMRTGMRTTNFARHNDTAINEALERWKEAERYFDMLPHSDLVDYAVYNLEAARRRYIFLLNLEKKQSEIAKELGLSEEFETERAKKPMREHMMRIPNDVLPQ